MLVNLLSMLQSALISQVMNDAENVRRKIEHLEKLSTIDIDLYHQLVASNEMLNENYVVELVYVENSILEL